MAGLYNVAIVGATGMVGSVLLSILESRGFPIDQLYLLASSRSAGETRQYRDSAHTILDIEHFDFAKAHFSFFCASNDIAATYIPKAVASGSIVFDKSSHYRYDQDVPLIVPEVNAHAIPLYKKSGIIANPNCNMIPLAVALKTIEDAVGIERLNVATYQSVSGSGKEAMHELTEQSRAILDHKPVHSHVYPQQIAFNVIPHIDAFEENGYTREEMKIVWELQKVFERPDLHINATAVRVPVYCGHSAAVHLELKEALSVADALELLQKQEGVEIFTGQFPYPTPVRDAAGRDKVCVGRVRADISHPKGLNLWIVADNLRKGAALNAVQTAEKLLSTYL